VRNCVRCGESAESEDRFCGQCGERLAEASTPAAARRTQTTLDAAEVNRRLGRVYLQQGRTRDAVRTWRKALELDPGDRELELRIDELERSFSVDTESP
jgi:Flp pilus assembly protein TadD